MKLSEFQISKISFDQTVNWDNDLFQDILNIIEEPNSPPLKGLPGRPFQMENLESSSQDEEDSDFEENPTSKFLRHLETIECPEEAESQGQLLYLRR